MKEFAAWRTIGATVPDAPAKEKRTGIPILWDARPPRISAYFFEYLALVA
jgi:hypothetical protein